MKILLLSTLTIICFLLGCSDEPTDVGRGLLPPGDTLRIESRELTSTFDTTFLVPISSNVGRLFVGLHDDIEAASIIEFAGIPAFSDSQRVDSAVISFSINYFFLDSSGSYGMNAYRMTKDWSASTFRWDSLSGSYSDTLAGSFVGSVVPGDTLIRLKLDTSLVRLWGQTGTGSLALRAPVNILGMKLILGFLNLAPPGTFQPGLTISYHDTADTTIRLTYYAARGVSVMHSSTPLTPGVMLLQSGTSTRSIVRFDSLAIPPKASITSAQLVLSPDVSLSLLNKYSRDSLIAYILRGTTFPYDTIALASICSPFNDIGGRKKYGADVKSIVQQWLAGRPNYGFILHTYGEFSSLDRFVLSNSEALPSLKPRLKVTYTVFP